MRVSHNFYKAIDRRSVYKKKGDSMKKFLVIWAGELISCIGSGMTDFALSMCVYQMTGSVSYVSLVTLLAYMPTILLSPIGGVLADRYDRRLLMIIGDAFSGLGILFGDEPTGALNSSATKEFMDILNKINSEETTILLVTHDAKVAAKADKVIYLEDGTIRKICRLAKHKDSCIIVNVSLQNVMI